MGGVVALTYIGEQQVDWLGVMLMISAGACYGWYLTAGQWTLVDSDSRTVALYYVSTMAAVVVVARVFFDGSPLLSFAFFLLFLSSFTSILSSLDSQTDSRFL